MNKFREWYDQGLLFVGAAGNSWPSVWYPAAFPEVMSVNAVDLNEDMVESPVINNQIEISAPGIDIYTTTTGGGYSTNTGTSFAAAHVSGVAALVWSYNLT